MKEKGSYSDTVTPNPLTCSLCPKKDSIFFSNCRHKGYASSILTFDSSPESSVQDASPDI